MQGTPQGTGCMRGEVQPHCKAPLVLYQKGPVTLFLRLILCHSHTGHLPQHWPQALRVGGAPTCPTAPLWGWAGAVPSLLPKKPLAKDLGIPGGCLTEANTAFLSGVT